MSSTGNNDLSVIWSDGHRSLYPYRQIQSLIASEPLPETTSKIPFSKNNSTDSNMNDSTVNDSNESSNELNRKDGAEKECCSECV